MPLDRLSAREREIVHLVADGISNLRIAKRLDISENTVKSHIGSIHRKLGTVSRSEIAMAAAGDTTSERGAPVAVVKRAGTWTVVTVSEELNAARCLAVLRILIDEIGHGSSVEVDLRDVSTVGPEIVRVLVEARSALDGDQELIISGASPQVARAVRLAGLPTYRNR